MTAAAGAVVVLRALGLGDLLTAVPALRALRAAFPAHHLVLAAPAWLAPLAGLTGAVDEVVDTPETTVGGLAPTGPVTSPLDRRLRGADVAVNLHGRGPRSHRLLRDAEPRRLVAFAHPDVPGTDQLPRWRPDEHEVARWCRLLAESAIPADPADLDLDPPPLDVPAARAATVVHPGAKDPARRWPPERWAEVARAEARAGRRVLVTGSPDEVALATEVAARAGLDDAAVLAGRTDLLELAAVVRTAGRVLSGDTGVAHLATAYRTPSVVLFGPVPPAEWGPPPDRPQHVALWAGRTGDPHGDATDPGLLAIGVADVLDAVATLPGR